MLPPMKWLKLFALLLLLVACQPQPAPTAVPDTLLQRPTRTPTPTPAVATPAPPTVTPVATPGTPMPPHDHDVTTWHEPDGHHHGANPADYPELWEFYLQQTAGQEIGYPWLSSVFENVYPFPMGNHEGFKFLAQQDTDCAQTGRPSNNEYHCIKSYLYMVHTLGNVHHMYTRVHSHYGVFEVCTLDGEQCGLIATGGHMDVGVLHNLYKQEICQLPGDPPAYPYDTLSGLNKIPYRALLHNSERPPRNGFNGQFWQYLGSGNKNSYPHIPNFTLGASWTEVNAWEYVDGAACANPERAIVLCPDGNAFGECAYTADTYQVFSIRLRNLPDERPYSGFTNVDGHIDETCQEASPICVPFEIQANVPHGLDGALLGYGVRQGQCDEVECQYYGGGGVLLPPGYEEHP